MGWANSKVLQSLFEPKTFEGGGKDQKNFQPQAGPMEKFKLCGDISFKNFAQTQHRHQIWDFF